MSGVSPGRLVVLNPGGGDPAQDFPHGAGVLDVGAHPPLNYHAYAACLRGAFHRAAGKVPDNTAGVILLLRARLKPVLAAARVLKRKGIPFFICWKETGRHQVAEALSDPKNLERFLAIAEIAEGFVSSTPDMVPLYNAVGLGRGGFVPTPYPLEEPAWDFSIPSGERRGVLVGTREFTVPSRNHLLAVLLAGRAAAAAGTYATVICLNRSAEKSMQRLVGHEPALRFVRGELPYERYIQVVAAHRLVFQLDRSGVPGQVAGDGLLCRVPCLGGNGAVECLASPDLNSNTHDDSALAEELTLMLRDAERLESFQRTTFENALRRLSFRSVANEMAELMSL